MWGSDLVSWIPRLTEAPPSEYGGLCKSSVVTCFAITSSVEASELQTNPMCRSLSASQNVVDIISRDGMFQSGA